MYEVVGISLVVRTSTVVAESVLGVVGRDETEETLLVRTSTVVVESVL